MNNQVRVHNGLFAFAVAGLLIACGCNFATSAFAYGPEGHRIVGAIADRLIADTPAAGFVNGLLDGSSLETVSNWADDAKYHSNPDDPDMVAFIAANPHNHQLYDHHNYHYTDIPIQESRYREDSVGGTKTDVVHMIGNCISILQKKDTPEINPTHITERMALRLLVHYVGDVHQPLHVGAAYFAQDGQLINPNQHQNAQADAGGNAIKFRSENLHAYWDKDAVHNAMQALNVTAEEDFAAYVIQHPPQNWESGPNISQWAAAWATEVLPIAAEAHSKLEITNYSPDAQDRELLASGYPLKWVAKEKRGLTESQYDQWAAQKVSDQLARAGYRLAALLQKIWPN